MQVCSHCGRQSRPTDKFCMHCGQRLMEDPQPAAATPNGSVASAKAGRVSQWLRTQPIPAVSVTAALADASPEAPAPAASAPAASAPAASAPADSGRPAAGTGPLGRLILQASASGEEVPSEVPLDGRNVTIGRAPACVVSLPDDPLISRLHAMLHFEGGHYLITDLGSSNGTMVNGTKIRSATALADGDRITVGRQVIIFTAAPSPAAGQASPASEGQVIEAAAEIAPADMPLAVVDATPTIPDLPAEVESAAVGEVEVTAVLVESTPAPDAAAPVSADDASTTPDLADAGPSLAAEPADSSDMALPADAFFGPSSDAPMAEPSPSADASASLAAWTESATAHTRQLRTELAELAERVDRDLAALVTPSLGSYGAAGDGGAALEALVSIAQQVARDPQHVNSLMSLADRCGDIASALQNQMAVITTLETIRERLAQLAEREGW